MPYLEIDISKINIIDIVLGPKHETPVSVLKEFLKRNGCFAEVRKSSASYR